MIRVSFVAVLVAVSSLPGARPLECERRERSLADLHLAQNALHRAKDLYPDCDNVNEIFSEKNKKNKSLELIDVALQLVSKAKKNFNKKDEFSFTVDGFSTTVKETSTTTEKIPTTTVKFPITTEKISTTTEIFPTTTETISTTTETLPTTMEKISTTTEKLPTTTEKISTTTEKLPTTTEKISVTTDNFTAEINREDSRRSMDCQELQAAGVTKNGVYQVWPKIGSKPITVRCDMETDGGGWTVIQRRGNFSQQENFDRDWEDYRSGFGNLKEDFWLGNDFIFALTNQGNYSLRIDMAAADGDSAHALYRTFKIENESANYQLHVDGYSGSAGDSMIYSNGKQFSTRDRVAAPSSRGCPERRKGGFWYDRCALCNPNGLYGPGASSETSISYFHFKGNVGLLYMDMKLKRL